MPRGAPKQFDRQQALDAAMQLFWEKGYEGAGMTELLARMGIGRQSLYDTYGSKKELYGEALEHYMETRLVQVREILEAPGSPLGNVRRALAFYEQHCTSGNGLGCLLVNSLAESGALDEALGPDVREELLLRKVRTMEAMFRATFERAKEAGELVADAEPRALARSMLGLASGVTVLGRAGVTKAMVRDAIRMHGRLLDAVAARAESSA